MPARHAPKIFLPDLIGQGGRPKLRYFQTAGKEMSSDPNRNDPCPCGSGRKYKQCCEGKTSWKENSLVTGAGIALLVLLGVILISMAFSRLGGGDGTPNCPAGQVWSEAHQHCH